MLPHRPVMLEEAIAGLSVRPAGTYLDATFGRGGHSAAILSQLGPDGRLHAFDRDPAAAAAAFALQRADARFRFHARAFGTLGVWAEESGLAGRLDGVLLDLGVSSPQFDDAARGFSFSNDGPLDMRMDPASGEPASAWLARASEGEIADVLWRLGEERDSRRIARTIVAARSEAPLTSTLQLAQLILDAHRGPRQKIHPATRSFQAIRLHVNQELEQLTAALAQAVSALAPGGRIAVISFHSLEDRIAKRYLRDQSRVAPDAARDLRGNPLSAADTPRLRRIGAAQFPSDAETAANPRARSAVLRVAERLP